MGITLLLMGILICIQVPCGFTGSPCRWGYGHRAPIECPVGEARVSKWEERWKRNKYTCLNETRLKDCSCCSDWLWCCEGCNTPSGCSYEYAPQYQFYEDHKWDSDSPEDHGCQSMWEELEGAHFALWWDIPKCQNVPTTTRRYRGKSTPGIHTKVMTLQPTPSTKVMTSQPTPSTKVISSAASSLQPPSILTTMSGTEASSGNTAAVAGRIAGSVIGGILLLAAVIMIVILIKRGILPKQKLQAILRQVRHSQTNDYADSPSAPPPPSAPLRPLPSLPHPHPPRSNPHPPPPPSRPQPYNPTPLPAPTPAPPLPPRLSTQTSNPSPPIYQPHLPHTAPTATLPQPSPADLYTAVIRTNARPGRSSGGTQPGGVARGAGGGATGAAANDPSVYLEENELYNT